MSRRPRVLGPNCPEKLGGNSPATPVMTSRITAHKHGSACAKSVGHDVVSRKGLPVPRSSLVREGESVVTLNYVIIW